MHTCTVSNEYVFMGACIWGLVTGGVYPGGFYLGVYNQGAYIWGLILGGLYPGDLYLGAYIWWAFGWGCYISGGLTKIGWDFFNIVTCIWSSAYPPPNVDTNIFNNQIVVIIIASAIVTVFNHVQLFV